MTSVRDKPSAVGRGEPHELFGLLFGFMQTQALCVAAKLGVADVIPDDGMSVADIAARVGAHEQSLYRLLRYLATDGVFEEVEPRWFTPTRLSELLRSDGGPTVRWQAIMLGSEHYRCWAEAVHSFTTGEPAFERAFGVLVDRPAVVESAGDVFAAAGVAARSEVVAGDFFTDELPATDAYVLVRILHDWDDERASTILRNCRQSLRDDGRLLLVETVLDDGPDPTLRKLFDLHMLVLLGVKERTEEEWRALLAAERFEPHRIVDGLIEARPALRA